jgi:DNA helicase-2/ATP-dependent DNA helicase PcrA
VTYAPIGEQNDVINSMAPVTVVLGGAGTGKTTTAAAAAAAFVGSADAIRDSQRRTMLVDGAVTPLPPRARVLFLSFSRTAVTQIIDRAAPVVGSLLERIDIVTFDGFAWRIINDWGAGYGLPPPLRIQSEAERKVPGSSSEGMRYADLIPGALRILENSSVAGYYARRYPLVICDEFQDTDAEEWHFLQGVAPESRRVLLGDVNQCIYADLKDIDPDERIAEAMRLPGAVTVKLPLLSHRDPSGILPAAADAARQRHFADASLVTAITSQRLVVTRVDAVSRYSQIVAQVEAERSAKSSVSIFTHTNASTTELSDALTEAGVRHEQVGLSEAFGEALNAQAAMLRYALDGVSGRRAFAVFVASNYRANTPLIRQIMERSNTAFERALAAVTQDLLAAADPMDVDRLADVIANAYSRLGTHRGQQTWTEAARRMRAAMRPLSDGQPLSAVEAEFDRIRHQALVGDAGMRPYPVQVMNLHQTKGREADVTILLLQSDEYHGDEGSPYPKLSRLLYVVLTRARRRAYIAVPAGVHELWSPLIDTYDRVVRTVTESDS